MKLGKKLLEKSFFPDLQSKSEPNTHLQKLFNDMN